MKTVRLVLANILFTAIGWGVALFLAILTAFLAAWLRGNIGPSGSTMGGPVAYVILYNFRVSVRDFLLVGFALGGLIGQIQFRAWLKHEAEARQH